MRIARLATIGLLLVAAACAHRQPIPLDSIDPRYGDYLSQVREQIKSRWSYPCVDDKATGRCEFLNARLLLEFGITTDGQVPYVTVRESSGLQIYDASAVNAVRAAAPFPPVPPEMLAQVPPGSKAWRSSRGLDSAAIPGDDWSRGPDGAAPGRQTMSGATSRVARWLAMVLLALGAGHAEAAEIKVISAGAVRSIVSELAPAFEKQSGHTVTLTFGTVGVVRQKLAAEPADLVIMSDTAVDEAIRQGSIVAGSRADIARTGMGVAVREGAPKPDISTTEALKQTLLAAKSIVYVNPAQGGTSGIHFAGVLQRLGIADAVKPKTTLVPGGYPAELVAKGEVELVAHQISEILPVKGVTLVGPLPKDVQKITTYSAGLPTKAEAVDAARAFIAFLTGTAVKPKFAAAGLDYKE